MNFTALLLAAAISFQPVTVAGSASAGALCQALAQGYGSAQVQCIGTTAGIQSVLDGTAEIAAASRQLTPEEQAQGLTAYPIARESLAVAVHPGTPIESLTSKELEGIWTGLLTQWPDGTSIITVSRESGSGTRASFDEAVAPPKADAIIASGNGTVKLTIAALEGSIGYYSWALGGEGVQVLKINGLFPWQTGYPLTREIFLVAREENDFIRFARSEEGQEIVRSMGYLSP